MIVKAYVLQSPKLGRPNLNTLRKIVLVARRLEVALGNAPLAQLRIEHFKAVQKMFEDTSHAWGYQGGVQLERLSSWLDKELDFAIGFRNHLFEKTEAPFDFDGVVETALILLSENARPDLSEKDKFFLAMSFLLMATALRIEELLTLPYDCLIDEDGLAVRYIASKGNKSLLIPICPNSVTIAPQLLSTKGSR